MIQSIGQYVSAYMLSLAHTYEEEITNKWFWLVVVLILGLAYFAYAAYCTYRGHSFNGGVKVHWPRFWQMGISCK
ncbi:MAG: hypothetical protein J6M18_00070 [Actinomycetaceae bacterium]|nr:hypothetical protein [Actinomycetaceae bacterium]